MIWFSGVTSNCSESKSIFSIVSIKYVPLLFYICSDACKKYCTHVADSCHRRRGGGEGLLQPWRRRLNVILQPEAPAGTSGTAFQSFVTHIMLPSPTPHPHINMLTACQVPSSLQVDTERPKSSLVKSQLIKQIVSFDSLLWMVSSSARIMVLANLFSSFDILRSTINIQANTKTKTSPCKQFQTNVFDVSHTSDATGPANFSVFQRNDNVQSVVCCGEQIKIVGDKACSSMWASIVRAALLLRDAVSFSGKLLVYM